MAKYTQRQRKELMAKNKSKSGFYIELYGIDGKPQVFAEQFFREHGDAAKVWDFIQTFKPKKQSTLPAVDHEG